MDIIESQLSEFKQALHTHAADYDVALHPEAIRQLADYFSLLTNWNKRLHLVAFASPHEFATRHVLESLTLLKYLPAGSRIVDLGSGGGLPIIPCLLAREDLHAILIEASKKKATFLREVLRGANIKARASVVAERFETIAAPDVGAVTCRALERFESMLPRIVTWAPANARLLLFGGPGLADAIEKLAIPTQQILLPNSERRYLFVLNKTPAKLGL